jgi:hypothetical protein
MRCMTDAFTTALSWLRLLLALQLHKTTVSVTCPFHTQLHRFRQPEHNTDCASFFHGPCHRCCCLCGCHTFGKSMNML